ncbi:uncharacterized protein LOC118502432 [Anopheles stephensi]|uniref:uncharacterized protein LOC118502432 n=1 Tax=Anopheles stephensi TaxID=30069 RepID=UPI001658C03A|nr:uncharacterized protein LOC118502432 [Anopheles stephensi]
MCRVFALLALLAVVCNAAVIPIQPQLLDNLKPEQRATLDEALAQLLENIRELLRTGDPERGIPVMAPLQTDQLDVDLSLGGLLDFTAILRNLFVDGLDRFQGTLTLNVMQMEFRYDFLFPDVIARGQYDADGRVFGLIPVFGFGNFHVAPRDLRIQGTALLRQLPSGYLHMPELKANVRLGSLQNNIEGMLLGGELSDLLNVVIQDLVPSVLINFAPEVTEMISRVGIPIADSILNTMTLDDLFALIPMNQLVENFRLGMADGFPQLNLPVLAPYAWKGLHIKDFDSGMLRLNAELKDGITRGLNQFNITNLNIEIPSRKLDFQLIFPSVQTVGRYVAKGQLAGFVPFDRSGKYSLQLYVSGQVPEYLRNNRNSIALQIRATVKPKLNEILWRYDVEDLFKMMLENESSLKIKMKILLTVTVGLVLACTLTGAAAQEEKYLMAQPRDNALNELVIQFLESFRESMVCANPDLGIPVLAPLKVDHLEMEIKQKLFQISGELNNLVVDGLNEFEIKHIDIKVLKLQLDFEFYFGAIRTKGKYKVKAKLIGLLPLTRFGSFRFDAKGLTVKGSASIGISGDKLQIRSLTVTPTLKSVRSDVKNVFLQPIVNFMFNRVVEGVVPGLINNNQQEITQLIEQQLKPMINEMLGDLSLQDLIDMVSGGGGSGPVTCDRDGAL